MHLPHGLLPWGEELPYTYGSRTPRGLWAKSSGGSSFLLPLLFPPLLIGPHLGGELPRVQGGIVVGAAWIKLSPMVASAAGLPRLVERGVVLGAGRIKALGLAGSGAGVVMTPAIRRAVQCPIKGAGWLTATALRITIRTSIQSHQRPLPLLHHHHHAFIVPCFIPRALAFFVAGADAASTSGQADRDAADDCSVATAPGSRRADCSPPRLRSGALSRPRARPVGYRCVSSSTSTSIGIRQDSASSSVD